MSTGQEGKPVLAINCGSSSLKFGLYRADAERADLICEGSAEEIGRSNSRFLFSRSSGSAAQEQRISIPDHNKAFALAFEALRESGAPPPESIGHRLVHGGSRIRDHRLFEPALETELDEAVKFAPLHVPNALEVLHATRAKYPGVPQVVCLDTAFHRDMPDVSKTFPLPEDLRAQGIERYGFHGISLESVLARFTRIPEKLVVAHLGNGCSVTAILNGKSIDTTMGLTPNAGVMMGTRSGDIDPGIFEWLLRHSRLSVDEIDGLLTRRSGLLGVSGLTSDVRELVKARKTNSNADLALRMFCYQVRKAIVSMAAALGGADTVAFTGGIGEHATELRDDICAGLKLLGNLEILVLKAEEDVQIAKTTARLTEGLSTRQAGVARR